MPLDSVIQDLRLALRRLAQTPAFTTVTIATLALAIGANTTTFSALNQFLLRPLPVERPKELVFLNRGRDGVTQSYPNYLAFRDRNRTLDGVIAGRIAPVGLSYGDKNSYIWGYEATGNYFDVLGIRALIGRTLTPEDDLRSAPKPVIVISYQAWQNRFAADAGIVGKKVKLNGLDYTVVGVAPKGFFGTELLLSPEFWVPMAMEPQIEPGNNWLDNAGTLNIWVAGRLKPGITWQQAESDLNSIAADRARTDRFSEGLHIHLSPPGLIGTALRGPVIGFASVLMAVAGLVLLIACVNIAGMLLARAADRRKEISIRLALGAPRWSLIRQLLTESFVLSIAGAVAGILIARWILGALGAFQMPINLPANTALPLDSGVLLFTMALCFLTTLLFGLVPAVQAARVDLLPALKNQLSERFRRLQLSRSPGRRAGGTFIDSAGRDRFGGPQSSAGRHDRPWFQSASRRGGRVRCQLERLQRGSRQGFRAASTRSARDATGHRIDRAQQLAAARRRPVQHHCICGRKAGSCSESGAPPVFLQHHARLFPHDANSARVRTRFR